MTSGLASTLVVEIGETEASATPLFRWLFPSADWEDRKISWLNILVASIPVTLACPVGLLTPPSV